MNPQKITQQWFAFQKQSFENLQSIWQLTQTQTSSTVDRLLDQAGWVPRENRQLLESWRALMIKERERLAAFVDRGFSIYEGMLESSPTLPTPKAKTAKTTKTDTTE
jgi:hypothetical protein